MHSLDFVTLVSQDLKVKVGRPSLGKFKNNGTTFFFFSLLSGLFLLQRGKKKTYLPQPSAEQPSSSRFKELSLTLATLGSCAFGSRKVTLFKI